MCSIQSGLFISCVVLICNIISFELFEFLKFDRNITLISTTIFILGGLF